MKIFLYTSILSGGGAERVLCQLANAFSKKDDVYLISSYETENEYFIDRRVRKVYLDKSIKEKKPLQQILRLRKMFKKERPDVCIAFLPQPNFKMLLAAAGLNIKTIISVRNDPSKEYEKFMTRILAKILYPMADGIVFQTRNVRNFFSKRIQNKSTVISNPVAPEFIVNKPYMGKREKKIVSVGRLTTQKNHRLLIDAFAEIHKENNNYKLVIYGEGELREELEAYIRDLNLKGFIELPGKVSDIKSEIYKASCFVLPSKYEGMPNALMEAMALGIPCISTDCPCGGPRSLIDNNKNGILVPVNDRQALASALKKVVSNGDFAKHLGSEACRISIKLAPATITHEWEKFMQATVDAQSSPGGRVQNYNKKGRNR